MYAHAPDICSAGRLLTVKIDGARRPRSGASRHVRSQRKPEPFPAQSPGAGGSWPILRISDRGPPLGTDRHCHDGARSRAPTSRPRRGTSRLRPVPPTPFFCSRPRDRLRPISRGDHGCDGGNSSRGSGARRCGLWWHGHSHQRCRWSGSSMASQMRVMPTGLPPSAKDYGSRGS